MKKIQLIVLFTISILLFSCNKDDNDTNLTSSGFNPPSWIIGSWLEESDSTWAGIGGFKFTKNNIVDLDVDGSEILNYGESIKAGLAAGIIKIEEIKTDDTYNVKVITSGVSTLDYKFNKGTSNTIFYELNSIYTTELTKQ